MLKWNHSARIRGSADSQSTAGTAMDLLSPGENIPHTKLKIWLLPTSPSTSSLTHRKMTFSVFSAAGFGQRHSQLERTALRNHTRVAWCHCWSPAFCSWYNHHQWQARQETHTLKRKKPTHILFHPAVYCHTAPLWDSTHATRQEQADRRRQSPHTWQGQWKMLACVYTLMPQRAGHFPGEGGNRGKSTLVTWSEVMQETLSQINVSICINRKKKKNHWKPHFDLHMLPLHRVLPSQNTSPS